MSSVFNHVRGLRKGYVPEEVDTFLAQARQAYERTGEFDLSAADIRQASFSFVRGGYDTHQVDSALDRLEDAFAIRDREEGIVASGEEGWVKEVTQAARRLQGRLTRPEGQRFALASRGEISYDIEDVDALCDRLLSYFSDRESMSVDDVRRAVFRRRTGKKGYDERVVDVYLDHVIEVMVAVR